MILIVNFLPIIHIQPIFTKTILYFAKVQIQHGVTPVKSCLAKLWGSVDNQFMKPLLTHSNPTLMETMPSCCLGVSRALTSSEQLSRHPAMVGGTLTDDLDPVEGNVISSAPGGHSSGKGDAFNFSPKNYDESDENGVNFDGNGGLKRRPPQLESPQRLDETNDKILPSHI